MQKTLANLALLAAVALLAACGGYKGTWPRLGPSTADANSATAGSDAVIAPVSPAAIAPDAQTQEKLNDINARLAQVALNFDDLERRQVMQIRSVSAAVSKVGDRTGSSWSLAQLELSRLSQIEGEIRTVRADAAGIAADLASYSARGLQVGQSVAQIGTLINQIDGALVNAETARQNARDRLSS